jgi:hypothetical protein
MIEVFNIIQDRPTRMRLAGDPPDVHITPHIGHIGCLGVKFVVRDPRRVGIPLTVTKSLTVTGNPSTRPLVSPRRQRSSEAERRQEPFAIDNRRSMRSAPSP